MYSLLCIEIMHILILKRMKAYKSLFHMREQRRETYFLKISLYSLPTWSPIKSNFILSFFITWILHSLITTIKRLLFELTGVRQGECRGVGLMKGRHPKLLFAGYFLPTPISYLLHLLCHSPLADPQSFMLTNFFSYTDHLLMFFSLPEMS